MDPSPELQSLLQRRLRIVEGSPQHPGHAHGLSHGGLSGAATAPTAARLPLHRLTAPGSLGSAGGQGGDQAPLYQAPRRTATATDGRIITSAQTTADLPHYHSGRHSFSGTTAMSSLLDGNRSSTSNLELRVSTLTVRNEQLSEEVEKMKQRLLKDEGTFQEERHLLLAETDELLAETDRMSEQSKQMVQEREELRAERAQVDRVQAFGELAAEVTELRSEHARDTQLNSELFSELAASRAAGDPSELVTEMQAMRSHTQQLSLEVVNFRAKADIRDKEQEASEARHKAALQERDAEISQLRQASEQSSALLELQQANQRLTLQVQELIAAAAELRAERDRVVADAAAQADAAEAEHNRLSEEASEAAEKAEEALVAKARAEAAAEAAKAEARLAPSSPAPLLTPQTPAGGSESRLRTLMTTQNVSSQELRSAIGAVEALVEEARREMERQEFRERRAACEQLGAAVDKADEALLEVALEVARRVGLDGTDIDKAEAKLQELRSMTEEQKAAKERAKVEGIRKKQAFLLVKKDDDAALRALIDDLEDGVRWADWRDYAGRTLWRCAQDLKAPNVQALLAPKLGLTAPSDQGDRKRLGSWQAQAAQTQGPALAAPVQFSRQNSSVSDASAEALSLPTSPAGATAFDLSSWEASNGNAQPPANDSAPSADQAAAPESAKIPMPSEAVQAEMKTKALRAVVQDDPAVLEEVFKSMPQEIWSAWENKAGKDLLTLSQERGSSCAYSVLAKALGILSEMKRDSFEERESVWIFVNGDVQPRRATVIEDTPEEADEILIEYWDGYEDASYVDRAMVRKIC